MTQPHEGRLRALELSRYGGYPVVTWLRQRELEMAARAERGLAYLASCSPTEEDKWRKAHALLRSLIDELTNCKMLLNCGLPRTKICICRRCKVVLLPFLAWDGYKCKICSHIWCNDNRAGYQPLAWDFWEKYMPGDRYKGQIEDNYSLEDRHDQAKDRKVEDPSSGGDWEPQEIDGVVRPFRRYDPENSFHPDDLDEAPELDAARLAHLTANPVPARRVSACKGCQARIVFLQRLDSPKKMPTVAETVAATDTAFQQELGHVNHMKLCPAAAKPQPRTSKGGHR